MHKLTAKRKRPGEFLLTLLIWLSAAFSVCLLAGIIGYVLFKGLRQVNWRFLTEVTDALAGTTGIAGNIINTLYMVILTLLIATPVGIGSALYLNEYARPGRLVTLITFTTETLAGIPSIVYGLFGMVFFGTALKLGFSILTGALTLSLMVLPLLARNTQEALKAVPEGYRQGALAMGSGRWHLIRTILLPCAMPGIVTGVILSVGRIVGESAALLFTAGSAYYLPRTGLGYLTKITDSGGTLTIQMYLSMANGQYGTAFGIAAVLLLLVFLLNSAAGALGRKWNVRGKTEQVKRRSLQRAQAAAAPGGEYKIQQKRSGPA